jgi:ABC-2 type transport system permease protein
MTFKILLKKELIEIFKTSKILVIPLIFLFFGFLSPLITKYMPEIFASVMEEMPFALPEMTWIDSFDQFFKNMDQIIFIAIILVFMGIVSDEKSKGTDTLVLIKNVKKSDFVLSKITASSILIIASYFISFLACLLYTTVLFESINYSLAFQASLLNLIGLLFLLIVTISMSTIFNSPIISGAMTVAFYFTFSIISLPIKFLSKYSPMSLGGYSANILRGVETFSNSISTIIFTIVLSAILVITSIYIYSNREA